MKFAHLLAQLTQEPLYMLPAKARTIIELVETRAAHPGPFPIAGGNAAAAVADPGVVRYYRDDEDVSGCVNVLPPYEMFGAVAVIPVEGVIGKRLSSLALMCGGCDVDRVAVALRAAMADTNVRAVLLDINSPGGFGSGLPELSVCIATVRRAKPVVSFTDLCMASAAYWIGAQADEIYCTPSATVGSIGAYFAAEDSSRAWQMNGRERLIFNGDAKFKAAGTEGKAWTDAEKALFQERSVKATNAIRAASQVNRVLDLETMQGQTFDGTDALAANLVDGLVNERDELLATLNAAIG